MAANRIVTLLPSATEIVCALGLEDKLVGVTHECDFPATVSNLPHVTRSVIHQNMSSAEIDGAVREHLETNQALYSLDVPLLNELAPDLVVTQALCDVCAVAEHEVLGALNQLDQPAELVNLEPMTLGEVFQTITLLGAVAGIDDQAARFRASLEERVARVKSLTKSLSDLEKPTVGFLEWSDPLFNGGHWTPELIEYAGGIDSFGSKHQPSRTISDEDLLDADPDVLIVALCGFDEVRATEELELLKGRIDFSMLSAHRNNRVHVLDGNSYFSRPGPRLVDALEILVGLLHPELADQLKEG